MAQAEKKPMEGAYMAPISLIKPDADFNPRMGDIQVSEEMLTSVKSVGVITPLQVRTKDGKPVLWVVDGCRRLKAAHMAKIKEVPVIQYDGMDDATALVTAMTSKDQQPFTEPEIRSAIMRLKHLGLTDEEIATNCGFTLRRVQEAIAIETKGIPELKESGLDARLASRIAHLEPDAQKAAIKGAKGQSREAGTQAVRMVERKAGRNPPGPPSSKEFPMAKDARRVLEQLDKWLLLQLKRMPRSPVRKGQYQVVQVMKGVVDVDDFTGAKRKAKIEKQK